VHDRLADATASARQASINFEIRIVSADDTVLPVVERKLRQIAVLGSSGRLLLTPLPFCIFVGAETKVQGCVDNLVCGGGAEGDSLGLEFCQCRLACSGSFRHRFEKFRLLHRFFPKKVIKFDRPRLFAFVALPQADLKLSAASSP
jgi:hypothetical protein